MGGENGRLLPPHSLTIRLHGGEAKQQTPLMPAAALLHNLQVTRSSYSVERAMEVLLQDCTGAPARMLQSCTANLFLFSTTRLHGRATNPMTTAAAAFLRRNPIILNIIIIHLLHSHIHCDLDHSCSKFSQHDLHFSRTEGNFTSKEGNFFLSTVGNTAQFQISRRSGGSHVTGEVKVELLFL